MTDLERMRIVTKWFDENKSLFNLDECFGIDIIAELFQLVQEANQP